MRVSAALVVAGLTLMAAQAAFSDGAEPNLVPLPIGMIPVTAGMAAIALGLLLGAVVGNARFRLAVGCAALGLLLVAYGMGLLFVRMGGPAGVAAPAFTDLDVARVVGIALWLLAFALGWSGIRQGRHATP